MYFRTLTFTLSLLQIYLLCAEELGHTRAQHGEHCNKTRRCDTSSFLTCKNLVCECQKTDTMFYDPVIKSCLVLVGEKCKYQLVKGKVDIREMQSDRSLLLEDELDCVQNAWCNRSGVCMCAGDYIELGNGTCISKRNLGETCTSDRECREDQFLICINGHCGCNETEATYNILIRQCVGKAGKPCIGSSAGCIYNAECIDRSAFSLAFTKRRMRQSVQICGCNPGFVADSSGFCRVGLGGQCSNAKPCANGFKCKDGQCVCQFENVQLALLRSQMCLSLVGGPCNETVVQKNESILSTNLTISGSIEDPQQQKFQCVDNAYCAQTNNDTLYQCVCDDGFVANKDGTCDLTYDSACSNGSPYAFVDYGSAVTDGTSWKKGLSCDRAAPLFCVNGFCQCESSLYEYDPDRGLCLGKFGARCEVGNTTLMNGCISGAECALSRAVRSPYGICTCSKEFTVANNRTCLQI